MTTGLKARGTYNTSFKTLTEPRDINPVLQNQMTKYVNQLQHHKKILEGKQANMSLVSLRNKWHQKQVQNTVTTLTYMHTYRSKVKKTQTHGTIYMPIHTKVKHITKRGNMYMHI